MTEIEVLVLCGLLGWVSYLHWRVFEVRGDLNSVATHVRGVADQVNRVSREVRRG